MSFVTDTLFGKTESPSVSPTSTMTAEQSKLLKQLSDLLSGQLGTGAETYPGDMTAGPSALQTQTWDELSRLISGGKSGTSAEAVNKVLAGTDTGQFDPAAIQEWYKDALVTPAMAEWEKNVAPAVQEKFISQNAGSSGAANRAIAGSAEDLMTSLNAQLADALKTEKSAFDTREFTAGQSDLDRLLQVPGMESTSTTDFLRTLGIGGEAGTTQQALNQADINELLAKWTGSQPYSNPWLRFLQAALGKNAIENVVSPGSQQEGLFSSVIAPMASSYLSTESGSGALTDLLSKLKFS